MDINSKYATREVDGLRLTTKQIQINQLPNKIQKLKATICILLGRYIQRRAHEHVSSGPKGKY